MKNAPADDETSCGAVVNGFPIFGGLHAGDLWGPARPAWDRESVRQVRAQQRQ